MNLSRTLFWRKLREQKILATHKRVAGICEDLISSFRKHPEHFEFKAKKTLYTERIIWQYWAQGFENVPPVVRECLNSVDNYAADYAIIRLTDKNLSEYLELPAFVQQKRNFYSRAHFADLLRLLLLKTYGGIWMDATMFLSQPIPKEYANCDFFVFRRDPNEPNIGYWRNTYAYYFGWAKGFRVNMLNSFIVAKKKNRTVSDLCDLMLCWWRDHNAVPDYFFFQILFDVYGCNEEYPLVSDTFPHYLQQSIIDPSFSIMSRKEILKHIPIHKLTYKQ